ncbi:MAG: MogA/MoaB family molybdenum cofactor biosynthesis protein [Acidobacteriota bacterium]|nr:MogA/MoaB family molybdenum cofactor biosynthesis protein [Acidobacteriota bacterium]
MIEAVVITISDSVNAGTREDASGPAVKARLEAQGWHVPAIEVLADDRALIANRLIVLADANQTHVIFTTGGTGLAARDVTPEATRDAIEREIPGIGEVMRAIGRLSTKLAPLSRGLAGNRGKTLVVNLPGSPRGAVESLDAIVDLVPHIIDLLNGITEHRTESAPAAS